MSQVGGWTDPEVGAAFAAFHRGRCVVDLWGGSADGADRPWTSQTLANVWSTTKGATAMAVARLVDERAITWEDPVSRVWPQFGAAGKAEVTIAQVMSHQAGLPGFVEPTSPEDQYDWEGCCAKLARQAPAWAPGTATSYHAMTFGWLAGEIVRRASGRSLGTFLRDVLTGPLEADVHVGLPEALEPRVARMFGPRVAPPAFAPPPPAGMALQNPAQSPEQPNTRAWRAAEIPAGNGQASAMGLARLYAPMSLGGTWDGVKVISGRVLDEMTRPATTGGRVDMLMGLTDSWGMGMVLNPLQAYGPGPRAFGHSGWGGSFACADPDLGLSMGYVCNQMGTELFADPRAVGLNRATTACAAARAA
jgi:CubicO group peptidase (beta-lactamase class C family)